jgi:hypothetical protein
MAQHRDRAGGEQAAEVFVAALAGRPKRFSPPLEFCRGVIPGHVSNSRPERNTDGSATVAAIALAPMMPIAGTLGSKQLTRLCRCHLARRPSISRILAIVPFSCSTIVCKIDRARELREPLLSMSNCLGQYLDAPQTLRCNDANSAK